MCKYPAHRRILFTTTAAVSLAFGMCGCFFDHFGPRAARYNYETADAKSATVLLNVLRAAYSNPLQFTDVTTVAGTASGSASLSATDSAIFPIPINKVATLASRVFTFTPQVNPVASASGTGTFNVANLNTQEFYYGLQTPISANQIATYLRTQFNGIGLVELLPLFISDVTISDGSKSYTFRYSATDQNAFFSAYSDLNQLVRAGLTVAPQAKKPASNVGPVLTEEEAKDPRLLAALVAAASSTGSNSSSSGSSGATNTSSGDGGSSGLTLKPVPGGYRLQKGADGTSAIKGYRFCFNSRLNPKPVYLEKQQFFIAASMYCNSTALQSGAIIAAARERHLPVITLTFQGRSLEGIFYFLGEMVRIELGLTNGEATSLAIPSTWEGRPHYFDLFHVERRPPSLGEPWVNYNGEIFSIRVDPSGQNDASSRVIQVLVDLLALQSSAKNLPAPNFITISTP